MVLEYRQDGARAFRTDSNYHIHTDLFTALAVDLDPPR